MKRITLLLVPLLFGTAAMAQAGAGQSYPDRRIRLVIPWPPGQATDVVGRVLAEKLSQIFGQPVVPDNRPGAGGMVGSDIAAKSPPDGYTLLAGSSGPMTVNPLLQKTAYDPEKDFIPVAKIGNSPYVLVINTSIPAANAKEFIAHVKANPGKYSFASSGAGATGHLLCEYFNNLAGLKATHVPYKGSIPALTDVISGQVAYAVETASAAMPFVRSGKLKALGVTMERGSAMTPGVDPIAVAANMPGFDVSAWLGILVPAGTPRPIVDRLSGAIETAMKDATVRERISAAGMEVDYRRAGEFGRDLKEQRDRFAEVIRKTNIKLD